MDVQERQTIERTIVKQLIQSALEAGYSIGIDNGEERYPASRNGDEILANMFATDEEYLYLMTDERTKMAGWVYLVYGNDGWDVINDYTTSLEPIMGDVHKLVDQYNA